MKIKTANNLVIGLMILLIVSCDGFTNLTPISQRDSETFYRTEGDMRVAVNATYAALKSQGTYGNFYWMIQEMRSDNTEPNPGDVTGLAASIAQINNFAENPASNEVETVYEHTYRVIARANIILSRIDGVEMNEELKDQYTGEALFLRALSYYNLAVAFGNIPLVLGETSSPNDEVTQVSADVVYDQIIDDLILAEQLLPQASSYSSSDVGRATKGAAGTLLGKVYLTRKAQGDAEAAAEILRTVIADGEYELLDDYANLWGVENQNNAESIFEIQFKSDEGNQGSIFTNLFSPSNALQVGNAQGYNNPTMDMYNAYEDGDLRLEPSMSRTFVNPQTGETATNPHIRKYHSQPPRENDADVNWVVLRYADALLMLAEALGESGEAYDLINEVRARAGLDDIDESTPGSFRDKLLQERRVELAFENHRWYDMRRLLTEQEIQEVMANADQQFSLQQARALYYIPQREIDVNPDGMTQN